MRGASMYKRKRGLAATAVAALGGAGGAAGAAISDQVATPGQSAVPLAQSVSAAQSGDYGVLRQPAAGGLPASVRQLPPDAVRAYGPNPALARLTYPNGDRSDPVYVIPG